MHALIFLLCLSVSFATLSRAQEPAYWLWSSVPLPRNLSHKDTLYVYQGNLTEKNGRIHHQKLGLTPCSLPQRVHLVYRAPFPLPNVKGILALFLFTCLQWQRRGVEIKGLQLDVDTPTKDLASYAHALRTLRTQLPPQYTLSVTGLGDWTHPTSTHGLHALTDATDEVVIQLYRGRHMHRNHLGFTKNLCQSGLPFKIGVLDSVDAATYLPQQKSCPGFQGTFIFLQKGASTP